MVGDVLTVIVYVADIVGTGIRVDTHVIFRCVKTAYVLVACVLCAVDAIGAERILRKIDAAGFVADIDGAVHAVITGQISCVVETPLGLMAGVVCAAIIVIAAQRGTAKTPLIAARILRGARVAVIAAVTRPAARKRAASSVSSAATRSSVSLLPQRDGEPFI